MLLQWLILTCAVNIITAEVNFFDQSKAGIEDIENPGIALQECAALNNYFSPLSRHIEMFSQNLVISHDRSPIDGVQRQVLQRNNGILPIEIKWPGSAYRAFNEDSVWWVEFNSSFNSAVLRRHNLINNTQELMGCYLKDFKDYSFTRMKLSKNFPNKLLIFLDARIPESIYSENDPRLNDARKTKILLIDGISGVIEKSCEFEILKYRHSMSSLRILETKDPLHGILYHRFGDAQNAWVFDSSSFQLPPTKLPWKHVRGCRTNKDRDVVACLSDYTMIKTYSCNDLMTPIHSMNLQPGWIHDCHFIDNNHLILTTDCVSRYTDPGVKSAVWVVDIENKKILFKKSTDDRYGKQHIKKFVDKEGNIVENTFVMHDFGIFYGYWHQLKISGLANQNCNSN